MHTYLQSLNGIAAFMNASDEVTASDFAHYVDTLEIDSFLPGINGIGFVAPVARGTEEAFIEKVTALGIEDFRIHPDTGNAEKMVIQYIYPQGPNAEAVGLDISFNEDRRRAALRARETREPKLTPRILLVQDKTRQPGFP
ncbi:CHASE domain-containing protein [Sulfitobacter sp. HI0054]|uniref:CHASE domain-containing protein n=1 Tax=Sulfitobacter sp. HI0054 TaxID=1822238 RepID=UPI001E445899|nr:CHASE domain-containing protein [Sulfitobacter sp. HI0054]